jgi:site-specific DNA-cytosine methylase
LRVTSLDLKDWLQAQCQTYTYDLRGIFRVAGSAQWPLTAANASELEARIREHLLPLPKEPAALANVLEVSIVDFLLHRVAETGGMLTATRGGERVYPDFHWDNRRLRVGEIKRLFTFPDDFELVGTRASVQAQLGNAVPPRLAEKVAAQVVAAID